MIQQYDELKVTKRNQTIWFSLKDKKSIDSLTLEGLPSGTIVYFDESVHLKMPTSKTGTCLRVHDCPDLTLINPKMSKGLYGLYATDCGILRVASPFIEDPGQEAFIIYNDSGSCELVHVTNPHVLNTGCQNSQYGEAFYISKDGKKPLKLFILDGGIIDGTGNEAVDVKESVVRSIVNNVTMKRVKLHFNAAVTIGSGGCKSGHSMHEVTNNHIEIISSRYAPNFIAAGMGDAKVHNNTFVNLTDKKATGVCDFTNRSRNLVDKITIGSNLYIGDIRVKGSGNGGTGNKNAAIIDMLGEG